MPRLIESISEDDDQLLWPEAGDTVFGDGDPSRPGVAALRWLGGVLPQWRAYAQGFRVAADALGKFIIVESEARGLVQPRIDEIALPLVALWRHYLELTLKALIPELDDLSYGPDTPLPHSHNLKQLWELAEPALRELAGHDDAFDAVKAAVMEFDRLDPKGEVFRYPVSIKGVWSLSELPETLDVKHLVDEMQAVANFFDGSWGAIDAQQEMRHEEAVYRAENADRSEAYGGPG